MPLVEGSHTVRMTAAWAYRGDDDGVFDPGRQDGALYATLSPDATVYQHKLYLTFVLPANGGEEIVDVRSFTSRALGEQVTATKALTLEVRGTGSPGGKLKVQPYSANPLTWAFGSATDSVTLNVGAHGQCFLAWQDGDHTTVADGIRNLSFSNPGTADVTVGLAITVGE